MRSTFSLFIATQCTEPGANSRSVCKNSGVTSSEHVLIVKRVHSAGDFRVDHYHTVNHYSEVAGQLLPQSRSLLYSMITRVVGHYSAYEH